MRIHLSCFTLSVRALILGMHSLGHASGTEIEVASYANLTMIAIVRRR